MKSQRSAPKHSTSTNAEVLRNGNASSFAPFLDNESEDARVTGFYRMLNESGRLDQIRASLRREIFTHLLDSSPKSASTVDIDLLTSTPGRLSLALTAGFIRRHFPASFSVFMAEANLSWLPLDEDETLLLSRLGVSSKQNHENCSALESVVQYLLKEKISEPPKIADLFQPNASWQICDKKKGPIQNVEITANSSTISNAGPRSAESILQEMRALIREELSFQPSAKSAPARDNAVSAHVANHDIPLPHQHSSFSGTNFNQSVSIPANAGPNTSLAGLDESRIHEYIEKMIERKMGNRRGDAASIESEKRDKKAEKSSKLVDDDFRETSLSKGNAKRDKKVTKKPSKDKSKSQKKQPFAESPTKPIAKTSFNDVAANPFSNTSVSAILTLDDMKRRMQPEIRGPTDQNQSNGCSSNLNDTRQRLEMLELEAEKLESTINQRLAAAESAQPLSNTLNLLERINNRRSYTSTTLVDPFRSSSSMSAQATKTYSSFRPTSTGFSKPFSSSIGCGFSSLRKPSSPQRRSVGSTLPASSKTLALVKNSMPLSSSDPYHAKEYSQSQSLLTSVPDADYRWASMRYERNMISANVPMPTPLSAPLQEQHLPFAVYPPGDSNVQREVKEAMENIFNRKKAETSSPQSSKGHGYRVPRRYSEDEEETENDRRHSKGDQSRRNYPPSVTQSPVVVIDSCRNLDQNDTQPINQTISSESVGASSPALNKVLSSDRPHDQAAPVMAPPAYSMTDVSPELNKVDHFISTAHQLLKQDSTEDHFQQNRRLDTSVELGAAEQTSSVAVSAVQPSQPSPAAKEVEEETVESKAVAEDNEVDDVLKKYMDMVLQQRNAAKTETEKLPYSSKNYQSNDDEDEDEDEAVYANKSRQPKIVGKTKTDDPPSQSDDFWS